MQMYDIIFGMQNVPDNQEKLTVKSVTSLTAFYKDAFEGGVDIVTLPQPKLRKFDFNGMGSRLLSHYYALYDDIQERVDVTLDLLEKAANATHGVAQKEMGAVLKCMEKMQAHGFSPKLRLQLETKQYIHEDNIEVVICTLGADTIKSAPATTEYFNRSDAYRQGPFGRDWKLKEAAKAAFRPGLCDLTRHLPTGFPERQAVLHSVPAYRHSEMPRSILIGTK